MKKLLLPALLGLFAIPFANAKTVSGVDVPAALDQDGTQLVLNGAGVRSKFFMDLYVGSLYLPSENSDSQAIVNADQPMAITLHIISGMITSDKMVAATEEGFENATGGDTQAIQGHIDQFLAVFRDEIKEGDLFRIAFRAEDDAVLIDKNGQRAGEINGGLAFKQAVFGIWLNENKPAQKSLRKEMLGN